MSPIVYLLIICVDIVSDLFEETMRNIQHLSIAIVLVALSAIIGVSTVRADSIPPVNYIGVNFSPIVTTVSYNYDFATGTLTQGTATASVFSTNNLVQSTVSDPSPPSPNGYGTFIGTAKPTHGPDENGAVLYEQSVCPTGYPTCFSDGSFTYGYMVLYTMRGTTLDQLTFLATQYYVQSGCFGGGSPRFSVLMSNGAEVQVYLGTYPAFADCPSPGWVSTGNLATDASGLRWDSSQIHGTFYGTYSEAVTLANTQGLTISAIFLGTDGGWQVPNAGTANGQTFLFQQIQVNNTTRFP